MAKVISLPDSIEFDVNTDETLLEAALRSGISWAHACGGRAKCSTCRFWVLDGLETCPARTEDEAVMANRLGLANEVRLACQLKPTSDLHLRRLVLDETDLIIASQLDRPIATRVGETKNVTIFFSDIADFTSLSERLSPYDTMYLLNRYFAQAGDIIEKNDGYIDKFVGDGLMAIFGIEDQIDAPLRSVNAALQTLTVVDQMKPFFADMYGINFDVRIGLHFGETVIGSLGSIGHERLTAIGDVVNVASRVEAANKDAGSRLLISDTLHSKIKNKVEVVDFIRMRLPGTSDRITLHEVQCLRPEAKKELNTNKNRETVLFAGKKWFRIFPEDELAIGEYRILEFGDIDLVVFRGKDHYSAFNNACPHLHLPLFERRAIAEGGIGNFPGTDTPRPIKSTVVDDRSLICRWHNSCFDLQTGDVKDWAPRLAEDGTSPGWEFLGDVSRNQNKLKLYACRIYDGDLWITLD